MHVAGRALVFQFVLIKPHISSRASVLCSCVQAQLMHFSSLRSFWAEYAKAVCHDVDMRWLHLWQKILIVHVIATAQMHMSDFFPPEVQQRMEHLGISCGHTAMGER